VLRRRDQPTGRIDAREVGERCGRDDEHPEGLEVAGDTVGQGRGGLRGVRMAKRLGLDDRVIVDVKRCAGRVPPEEPHPARGQELRGGDEGSRPPWRPQRIREAHRPPQASGERIPGPALDARRSGPLGQDGEHVAAAQVAAPAGSLRLAQDDPRHSGDGCHGVSIRTAGP